MGRSVIASIATISFLGIVAKLFGLLREGVFAAYFGTSAEMDVFGLLTGYVTTLMAILGSSLASSYSPLYVRNLQQRGEATAAARFSHLVNQFLLFTVFGYVLVFFVAPIIAGYISKQTCGVAYSTVLLYTRLMFATVITGGTTRLFVTALNGLRKYGWMQLTQILYSVLAIAMTFVFGKTMGIGVAVAAYVVNSMVQLALLWFVFFHGERRYECRVEIRDEETCYAWKSIIPIFLGTETYMLGLTIDRTIGLSLGMVGIAAALNYAGTLYGMVNTVVTAPIQTVFCTEMYRKYYKTEQREVLYDDLGKIINHIAFIVIPIALFLTVTSTDFITVVLRRGAFDEHSVSLTAACFCFYALSTPFYAIRSLFTGVHIALNDRKTPMWGGVIFLVANILLSFGLSRVIGIAGITLGAFGGVVISMLYQYFSLKKNHGYDRRFFTSVFLGIVLASIIAAVVAYFIQFMTGGVSVYARFVISALVFFGLYGGVLYLLKSEEMKIVYHAIIKK